jgi:trigger factor
MQVTVETTQGLERKISVQVPAEKYNEAFDARIAQIARTAKISGFRPGKVPLKVVKQQYGGQATQETLSDLIQSTLGQAISQEKLNPAGYPQIDSTDLNDSGELSYTALFEVYPEIALADTSTLKVERVSSEVADSDIDTMLETLRKQRAQWNNVERAAADGDQVTVDFVGTIDGEEFDGGKGEGVALTLGSGQMIPGFEDQVVGMKAGEEKAIDVTFPADYNKEDLQNKAAQFAITAHKVAEQTLPEVDTDFVKAFGVEDGDVAKLRENLAQHMQRELEQKVKAKSKTVVMDGLIEQNPIEVPGSLVKQEIQRLKEQAFQQFGGNAPIKLEDFPDEPFEEDAARRVKLGLLLGEIIKQQELKADADKVKAMIEQMASSYEQPEQVVNYYYENPQMLQSIESVVVEDQAVEWVLGQAKVTESKVSFDELMKEEAQ